MKDNRVILCDFDGTLIFGDLERMFMRYLLQQPEIKFRMLLISLITLPINLLLNQLGRPSIFKSWTVVLKNREENYIHDFLSRKNSLIKRKPEGWQILNSIPNAKRILLTGCYGNLIRQYLKYNNLNNIFEQVIATEMKSSFLIRQHPFAKGKVQFVDKQNYNIGIANEPGDHFYLDLCDEQYYV